MSPWARVVGLVIVALVASCTLPPRARAADVELTWNDNSVAGPGLADGTKVYEQTPTGVTIPGLTGRWTLRASPARMADVDGSAPGLQQRTLLPNVSSGVHTYVVTAYNTAGESGPSNTVSPNVPVPAQVPPSPTGLIFTITVP